MCLNPPSQTKIIMLLIFSSEFWVREHVRTEQHIAPCIHTMWGRPKLKCRVWSSHRECVVHISCSVQRVHSWTIAKMCFESFDHVTHFRSPSEFPEGPDYRKYRENTPALRARGLHTRERRSSVIRAAPPKNTQKHPKTFKNTQKHPSTRQNAPKRPSRLLLFDFFVESRLRLLKG